MKRYDRVAIALHWLIGLLLAGQIAFGWLLDDIAPRRTPARAGVVNLHKSIGIVIGLLILYRLTWRLRHRPPDFPAAMSALKQSLARQTHWLLYALMVVVPLSGVIASNFSRFGVRFFGLDLPPLGPESRELYRLFNSLHQYSSWTLAALATGHALMAIKHALIDRDGVFARILPGPRA